MSITISAKTDYSTLFSSLNSSSSSSSNSLSGLTSLLSDYASIKSGAYGKLMKAYYSETGTDAAKSIAEDSTSKTKTTTEDTESKKLNKVQTATDALKESADTLYATGTDSLFNKKEITTTDANGVETTTRDYDTDAIYKAVSGFVTNYNSVISAVDDADNDTVSNRGTTLSNISSSYKSSLSKIGITINDDNTLKLDADTFKKADVSSVKSLFNGTGSYAYQVSAQASMIDYAAESEAAVSYTSAGTYSSLGTSGSLYSIYS